MFSTKKTVLPNFIRILTAAALVLGANQAMAAHHGDAEDKIKDLKDMSSENIEPQVEQAAGELEGQLDETVDEARQNLEQQIEEEMEKKAGEPQDQ